MSRLLKLFEEKLSQAGEYPPPLEMGVRPPRRLGFVDAAEMKREIRALHRKVNRLLKKHGRT
jgi:hypothetical protein